MIKVSVEAIIFLQCLGPNSPLSSFNPHTQPAALYGLISMIEATRKPLFHLMVHMGEVAKKAKISRLLYFASTPDQIRLPDDSMHSVFQRISPQSERRIGLLDLETPKLRMQGSPKQRLHLMTFSSITA